MEVILYHDPRPGCDPLTGGGEMGAAPPASLSSCCVIRRNRLLLRMPCTGHARPIFRKPGERKPLFSIYRKIFSMARTAFSCSR